MPELPEVHNFKRYFDETALGRTVDRVTVQDDKIIRNMPGDLFAEAMAGRTFESSLRRGKYLFARLDNEHDVLLHFGMTGDLNFYELPEDRSKYERFVFEFSDGTRLGFDDPRKFARIHYLEDRAAYIDEIGLGPDALDYTEADLLRDVAGRTITLKGLLLDQRTLAGIGNLYADEICYRARIHPGTSVAKLSEAELHEVYTHLHDVMHYAVDNAPYYKEYPDDWFWHVWREEGKTGPEGYGEVKKTKVAGRTTYYVTEWQREVG